jgi:large conductance mechanosensitive channel
MSFAKEFREFAVKGNVVDLAVGVIIGGAFGKIVDSLVGDIIMPVIGAVTGGLDFSNYFVALAGQKEVGLEAAKKAGAVLAWGNFVTILVNFIILAFIIFLMVRQIAKLKSAPAEEAAAPAADAAPVAAPLAGDPTTLQLLREIRDELRTRGSN